MEEDDADEIAREGRIVGECEGKSSFALVLQAVSGTAAQAGSQPSDSIHIAHLPLRPRGTAAYQKGFLDVLLATFILNAYILFYFVIH